MSDEFAYHPGDMVRIREYADMLAQYGADEDGDIYHEGQWFTMDMRKLCGYEFIVQDVYHDEWPDDNIVIISGHDMDDCITDWMVELADTGCDDDDDPSMEDYMSILGEGE